MSLNQGFQWTNIDVYILFLFRYLVKVQELQVEGGNLQVIDFKSLVLHQESPASASRAVISCCCGSG